MKSVVLIASLLILYSCNNEVKYKTIIDNYRLKEINRLDSLGKIGQYNASEVAMYKKNVNFLVDSLTKAWGEKVMCDSIKYYIKNDSVIKTKRQHYSDSIKLSIEKDINDALKTK